MLSRAMQIHSRFAAGIVDRSIRTFGELWATDFERIAAAFLPDQKAVEEAAKGYAAFTIHCMRLQAAFERERQYKTKTYEQASAEVYFNERHMLQEYLPALLISHFLWPHHYRQLQFFCSAFLSAMRVAGARSFAEIGIGTGLYSGFLLCNLPSIHGIGFDISPSAKQFTEKLVASLGCSARYRTELRDITVTPVEEKIDWLVCVEVLEHLEDPVTFLKGLRRNMATGARAFITAAINAAHTDHIYLYRNVEAVEAHLLAAGFTIEQFFAGVAYKTAVPGVPVPTAAAFIVY